VRMTDNSVVTSDLWYRYDMGWNALASYDLGTDGTTAWDIGTRAQSVAYLGMTPLAEAPGANPSTAAYRHYLHDHLGSTRALYDGTKQHRARIAYTPYGEQAPSTAGTTPTYTFTGKQWEPETGLYFFPYRYYAPTAARWAWRDPLGMVDGPNVYGYVVCNPIAHRDLKGESLVLAVLTGTAIAIALATLVKLGEAACMGNECIDCMKKARATIKRASESFEDPLEFEQWLRSAKPGSECLSLCNKAAQDVIESLYNPPPVLLPL